MDVPTARPTAWLRGAAAAGWPLPLALAHDLGLLLTQPADRLTIAKPGHLPFDEDTAAYLAFLQRVAGHPLVRQLPSWRPPMSDAVVGVILARLVEGVTLPDAYRVPPGPDGVRLLRLLGERQEAQRRLPDTPTPMPSAEPVPRGRASGSISSARTRAQLWAVAYMVRRRGAICALIHPATGWSSNFGNQVTAGSGIEATMVRSTHSGRTRRSSEDYYCSFRALSEQCPKQTSHPKLLPLATGSSSLSLASFMPLTQRFEGDA